MAFLKHNGRTVAYRLLGAPDKPLIVLAHPLGMSQAVWDDLLPSLLGQFRVLTWDLPGHGASAAWPASAGPITPEALAAETLALVQQADAESFHFIGTSIGGVIGQQLLIGHGSRLLSATLTNTGAVIGTPQAWQDRAGKCRELGVDGIAADIVPRWFGPAATQRQPALIEGWTVQMGRGDSESYALLCEMLGRVDFSDRLPDGPTPVRLIAGADDLATPPSALENLGRHLGGVAVSVLGGVGHVPSEEAPEIFLKELL
ncbi:alpha/beta fold hydrolase [Marinobacter sp. JSM 1782161]|uniref:alpha/beta fold hydrolase n=1 Tax=Marinobacter sp. JSM 1782161 TaxID=2685906 RepID=UPI0014020877|nr:alpha/beta fold hydrolase [Marinobacter sp. JSM 1782161]